MIAQDIETLLDHQSFEERTMRQFTVFSLVDSGGWGAQKQEICCISASTAARARILAFEILAGDQLSTLSHWDIEEIS